MIQIDRSVLSPLMPQQAIQSFLKAEYPACEIFSVAQWDHSGQMAEDVLAGLSQSRRRIPTACLYDREGSLLYEQITLLPEYYQTRTEADLLRQIAPDLSRRLGPMEIIELGSGSSSKTRILLDAWERHQLEVTYIPVDVSAQMLECTARKLIQDYPRLRVMGMVGRYEEALALLPESTHRLILFLGGTIGNFTPEEQTAFVTGVTALSQPGTRLLLGFDYQPHPGKPVEAILQAYNDEVGVTAQFNRNILAHLNKRLAANFDLDAWAHEAIYNPQRHQIEMALISQLAQDVHIQGQSFHFAPGEGILTEISRRYDPVALARWFEAQGWRCLEQWTDARQYYGLMLLEML